MSPWSGSTIRAEYDNIEQLIAALSPVCGGIWLATDIRTLVHWIVMADRVVPVIESPDDQFCRAFGIVTIVAPDGEPVFLINERDVLEWRGSERVLSVRELGDDQCEIRLERLDDLDARLIDSFNLSRPENAERRTLAVGERRFVQVYDDQLPTGCPDADGVFRMIEMTVEARRRLIGPSAGTLDVLEQMERDLVQTLRTCPVESYIWAATLQERIARMRQLLAA